MKIKIRIAFLNIILIHQYDVSNISSKNQYQKLIELIVVKNEGNIEHKARIVERFFI